MTVSSIDLGFAVARVPAGTHVCHIYSDAEERNGALLRFLASGLRAGEATACFSDNVTEEMLQAHLDAEGVSLAEARRSGSFTFAGTRDVYFAGGHFDPDRMLDRLERFHEESIAADRPAARVIGEMPPDIARIPGGTRLLEYEARVNALLRTHPVTAVCQYDAHAFGGADCMDVLMVHPMMLVRGAVVLNPFFIPPEEFLRR